MKRFRHIQSAVPPGWRLAIIVAALFSLRVAVGAEAAEEADRPLPDKSGYTLFHPTPKEMMRELTPDRPDKTESPYTVDAGHFQLELSFAEYTRNKSTDVRTDTWNVAPANIKVGLSSNADLQFIFENYLDARTKDRMSGTTTTRSGFGDITMRLKVNLWGNDSGKTALAILPFIKFPTNTGGLGNNSVEGGVIVPVALKLPGAWDMGAEAAIFYLRNANDHGYHKEFVNSVTFGHDLLGKLGGYVEFFSDFSTEREAGWVGTADVGLTYGITENIQLDCGVNIGVTRAADDLNSFAGMTVRF